MPERYPRACCLGLRIEAKNFRERPASRFAGPLTLSAGAVNIQSVESAVTFSREPVPICSDERVFLLTVGPRLKTQIANPAPAANKKPGKLFFMDSTTPAPKCAADAQADKIGPLPFSTLPCRQGSPFKCPQHHGRPSCDHNSAEKRLRIHSGPAPLPMAAQPVFRSHRHNDCRSAAFSR
jgi:hypothetical protein